MIDKTKKTSQPVVYKVVSSGKEYVVYRDDKPLKTPAGNIYALPSADLGQAVADEWRAAPDPAKTLKTAMMPLTQLAATAIDIVAKDRARTVRQIVAHAESELLCHRADLPVSLANRQKDVWQPYLDWCAERFGARLAVSNSVMPIRQPPEALMALHKTVEGYDNFILTGLSVAVDAMGSLVLGLALAEAVWDKEAVFQAAELDANHQKKEWGDDPVIQARHKSIRQDLEVCERWFRLLLK